MSQSCHICSFPHPEGDIPLAARDAGGVADEAETKKLKYSTLLVSHHFTPVAIETSGVFLLLIAIKFFTELGQQIISIKLGSSFLQFICDVYDCNPAGIRHCSSQHHLHPSLLDSSVCHLQILAIKNQSVPWLVWQQRKLVLHIQTGLTK